MAGDPRGGVPPPGRRTGKTARHLRRGQAALLVSEEGSSIVEFIFLGVLLVLPVVYLIISASQLQAASYAAVGAADHAAKAFVTAASEASGAARAQSAVSVATRNMKLDPDSAAMTYGCSAACLDPGSTVTVRVTVKVALPLLPPGVTMQFGSASSTATQRVDRFG